MKQAVLVLLLLCSPAVAQTPVPDARTDTLDQGLGLIERGAQMLLDHMMDRVEPSLKDMTDALKQAQPKIMEIMAMIDDLANYHAPERLPNGDIILRRKTPAELKLEALQGQETEL